MSEVKKFPKKYEKSNVIGVITYSVKEIMRRDDLENRRLTKQLEKQMENREKL